MRCSYHKVQGPLENCDHYDDIGVMCYMGELSMLYLVTKGPPEVESVQCEACTCMHLNGYKLAKLCTVKDISVSMFLHVGSIRGSTLPGQRWKPKHDSCTCLGWR